jgi:Zn finger protein HypA/HybF involved in hydrogenase expression
MKQIRWICDRCSVAFNHFAEQRADENVDFLVLDNGRRIDLCPNCHAKHQRFLAGEELERKPPEQLPAVRGENSEAREDHDHAH